MTLEMIAKTHAYSSLLSLIRELEEKFVFSAKDDERDFLLSQIRFARIALNRLENVIEGGKE